jgi:hypothetical protein
MGATATRKTVSAFIRLAVSEEILTKAPVCQYCKGVLDIGDSVMYDTRDGKFWHVRVCRFEAAVEFCQQHFVGNSTLQLLFGLDKKTAAKAVKVTKNGHTATTT